MSYIDVYVVEKLLADLTLPQTPHHYLRIASMMTHHLQSQESISLVPYM
jgi:hypothetical protein